MADVAGVHHDEPPDQGLFARPLVLARRRRDRRRVGPVWDHTHPPRVNALRLEAALHRLADRHDPLGPV